LVSWRSDQRNNSKQNLVFSINRIFINQLIYGTNGNFVKLSVYLCENKRKWIEVLVCMSALLHLRVHGRLPFLKTISSKFAVRKFFEILHLIFSLSFPHWRRSSYIISISLPTVFPIYAYFFVHTHLPATYGYGHVRIWEKILCLFCFWSFSHSFFSHFIHSFLSLILIFSLFRIIHISLLKLLLSFLSNNMLLDKNNFKQFLNKERSRSNQAIHFQSIFISFNRLFLIPLLRFILEESLYFYTNFIAHASLIYVNTSKR